MSITEAIAPLMTAIIAKTCTHEFYLKPPQYIPNPARVRATTVPAASLGCRAGSSAPINRRLSAQSENADDRCFVRLYRSVWSHRHKRAASRCNRRI